MRELGADEVDEMLTRNGIGVLAMVDDGVPYAIPMSFGYDSTEMVFPMQWGATGESRKERAIESNPNVCFAIYEQDPDAPSEWRSVVITGELYEIPEEDAHRAYASLAANAEIPADMGLWGVPFEDVDFQLYGIDLEACSGRAFSTAYDGWE